MIGCSLTFFGRESNKSSQTVAGGVRRANLTLPRRSPQIGLESRIDAVRLMNDPNRLQAELQTRNSFKMHPSAPLGCHAYCTPTR